MRKIDDKKIFIILTNTGTVLTRLIGMYTKAPYNHVSICFDDELEEIYSFGRTRPWNPLWGGFVQEKLTEGGIYNRFDETVCTIYELKIPHKNYNYLRNNIEKFKKYRRRYYFNTFAFLGVVINHPIKIPYGYFCSYFVAHVLKESGIELFEKDPALVIPSDVYTNKRLTEIYSGKIQEYSNNRISINAS